jgi:broad specificity phosphatase PhoE
MKRSIHAALAIAFAIAAVALPLARAAAAPAAPGTRTLYLIRHGWYDDKDPADPRVGKHLDALGRDQARRIAERLRSLPVHFTEVRTSAFSRAMETGDIIGSVLKVAVVRDSLLNECTPPTDRPDIRYDGPETPEAAQAQLEAA